ncbi:hypothetical protein KKD52_13485 [Myxococcota bacterium]|jgi:hypothetical protein|nr:hypothetical protein [Myxococcota bacterium]MBU1412862.1 hypothetical protein [Myxococcota bacterium]MBU1511366.1 hypothetical protein [Myxococcota bacterium]PKN23074.1 MAG: hypothetical protein CVU65_14430 [Deltaproteobacteria bacterium HGW-Deltaproteobacteria-22]
MTLTSLFFALSILTAPNPQAAEEISEYDGPMEIVTPPAMPSSTCGAPVAPGCGRTATVQFCRLQPCPANFPCYRNAQTAPVPPEFALMPAPPRIYKNPRIERPFGVNFNYAGPALFGVSLTHFITPTLQLEAGIGPITRFFGGTYHFGGEQARKLWTPYAGLSVVDFINGIDDGDNPMFAVYVPFGVQYSGRGGMTFSIEGAWAHISGTDGESIDVPWFGIKIGYRF